MKDPLFRFTDLTDSGNRERWSEREIYNIYESCSRFKNFDFSKCILRELVQNGLAVKIVHATPMPTLPTYREIKRDRKNYHMGWEQRDKETKNI